MRAAIVVVYAPLFLPSDMLSLRQRIGIIDSCSVTTQRSVNHCAVIIGPKARRCFTPIAKIHSINDVHWEK
ncbi:MAG: hypothetical protein QOJ42_4336 [Acidobacteriaceae bacterium]|jgi:hypothetical protein|nr:hypothetical protein [Acidobacteriaceae bacterium]